MRGSYSHGYSYSYGQTWANDHLSITTTILESRFTHVENKETYEQRPPVNIGHLFLMRGRWTHVWV